MGRARSKTIVPNLIRVNGVRPSVDIAKYEELLATPIDTYDDCWYLLTNNDISFRMRKLFREADKYFNNLEKHCSTLPIDPEIAGLYKIRPSQNVISLLTLSIVYKQNLISAVSPGWSDKFMNQLAVDILHSVDETELAGWLEESDDYIRSDMFAQSKILERELEDKYAKLNDADAEWLKKSYTSLNKIYSLNGLDKVDSIRHRSFDLIAEVAATKSVLDLEVSDTELSELFKKAAFVPKAATEFIENNVLLSSKGDRLIPGLDKLIE